VYIGGLTEQARSPRVNLDVEHGRSGIRGTEFIARLAAGSLEVDLISGAVDLPANNPAKVKTYAAPIKIFSDGANARTAPLTQAEYNAINAQLFGSLVGERHGGREVTASFSFAWRAAGDLASRFAQGVGKARQIEPQMEKEQTHE
jgi:hypothetical protein